jgi:hypothetical protein
MPLPKDFSAFATEMATIRGMGFIPILLTELSIPGTGGLSVHQLVGCQVVPRAGEIVNFKEQKYEVLQVLHDFLAGQLSDAEGPTVGVVTVGIRKSG